MIVNRKRDSRRRCLVTAAAVLAAILPAAAHEFWVTPSAWIVEPGRRATLLVNVGDQFPNASSFTTPDRIDVVRLVGPGSDTRVPPPYRREKDSLDADVQLPNTPGTYIGVVTVKPRVGEKSAAVFRQHVEHQGLDDVAADRATRGEDDRPVRERYSRYGKTLLRVGARGAGAHVTKPLGLKIELVPHVDPTTLQPGSKLRVLLLLDGRPAPNALVGGINAASNAKPEEWPLKARTDATGEVELTLNAPGAWLIRAVRTVRRTGETGELAADWESYWASLSFHLAR